MSQEPTPKWLDTLTTGPAPDFPPALLGALRARRRERARRLGGAFAACLGVAVAAWFALVPWGGKPEPSPVADHAAPPSGTIDATLYAGVATAGMAYLDGLADVERLVAGAGAGEERPWRIGDHWDPERVRAWVLD